MYSIHSMYIVSYIIFYVKLFYFGVLGVIRRLVDLLWLIPHFHYVLGGVNIEEHILQHNNPL